MFSRKKIIFLKDFKHEKMDQLPFTSNILWKRFDRSASTLAKTLGILVFLFKFHNNVEYIL